MGDGRRSRIPSPPIDPDRGCHAPLRADRKGAASEARSASVRGEGCAVSAMSWCALSRSDASRKSVPSLTLGTVDQRKGVHVEVVGEAFHCSEGEVSLSAFDAAEVGAVDSEVLSEGFLAEAELLAVSTQVVAYVRLQLALHDYDRGVTLLISLQTYK